MSTLNVNRIVDASGGVFAPASSVFKNRIINGDFRIDQRNAGASVTPSGSAYTLDRWQLSIGVASKLSVQQSSTAPTRFRNSALITTASAYTASAGDYLSYCQKVEGFNFADCMWGTANAQTVTLSFWVRSSLTGTFSGALQNDGASRSYPFTYTISAANTFEYKTVTITGDTSGTWNTTTGKGVEVHFNLGSGSDRLGTAGAWNSNWNTGATGSVALVQTAGATFYITGVQLEVGTQATSFEYRQYGTELSLCQRYYYKWLNDTASERYVANIQAYSTTAAYGKLFDFPVPMRVVPTCSRSGTVRLDTASSGNAGNPSTVTLDNITRFSMASGNILGGVSGLVAGNCSVFSMASNGYFDASAEL